MVERWTLSTGCSGFGVNGNNDAEQATDPRGLGTANATIGRPPYS